MRDYLNATLVISLLFHAVILSGLPSVFKNQNIILEKEKKKEIKIIPERIEKIIKKQKIDLGYETKPLPYMENIMSQLTKENQLTAPRRPQLLKKDIREIILSETFPDKELKKDPTYMDYYRLIREKIRANTYRNYKIEKKGKVLASFLICSDGTLSEVDFHLKSEDDETLEKIALRSIEESAPFPAFPAELKKYSRLQFNISIHFKSRP